MATSASRLLPPLMVTALVAALLLAVPTPARSQPADGSVSIIKDNEIPSNAEVAVRLSEETPLAGVTRVVISRDDEFADALASGVLQRESPLLLVPRDGPVPDRVLGEIDRLGANAAVILGGTGAVSEQVEVQLAARGMTIERRQGASRIETAVEIARREVPQADTAIIARAFAADPNNPTQAFADALAAGGLAAEQGWPILLTQTDVLTGATRDYLATSGIRDVKIVGGIAAVSEDVANQIAGMIPGVVERIAGAGRGGTATEIAKERGADDASDVARAILVDGTSPDGWAGGFAAAGHSAFFDAPILLADGVRLFPETEEFLEPGQAFAQAGDLALTCVVHPLACTEGRRALGLVDYPLLAVDPPRGVLIDPGQTVTISLTPVEEGANVPVFLSGTCVDQPFETATDGNGRADVPITQNGAGLNTCQLTVFYEGPGAVLSSTVTYTLAGTPLRQPGENLVASEVLIVGSVVPRTAAFVTDDISCTMPDGTTASRQAWAMQALYQQEGLAAADFVTVGSDPLRTAPGSSCTLSIDPPPETTRVFWGLYTFSDAGLRVPLALGTGTQASFDFDDLGGFDDVSVRWVLQIDAERPSLPPTTPPGPVGLINNIDGLVVDCQGAPIGAGIFEVPPGTQCTASAGGIPGLHVLFVQPGADVVSAPEVTFTAQDDPRWTTLRAQAIANGATEGDGSSCASAIPATRGQIVAGEVADQVFYRYTAAAGESVRIRLDALSDSLDPFLFLFDGSGQTELARNDDDPAGGFNSRIDHTFAQGGTYCIQASSFGGTTGPYLFAVDRAPSFVDAGTLSADVPAMVYAYNGARGDDLVVEMRAPAGSATDPLIEIYDANGQLVASDDDGGAFPNARVEYVLPADGSYDVVATVFGQQYGPFTFEGSFPPG